MDPLSYRHRIVSGSNPENYIEETKLTILFAVCFFVFYLYDSHFRIAASAITFIETAPIRRFFDISSTFSAIGFAFACLCQGFT